MNILQQEEAKVDLQTYLDYTKDVFVITGIRYNRVNLGSKIPITP